MPKGRALLLGTGTSTGIPVIGCPCRVCTSVDPRDNRTRCSAVVDVDGLTVLIDAGPDLRHQALRERLHHIDAVLFTHHHFDHVVGLDDLRPFLFRNRAPIPCYAAPDTAAVLRSMFSYIFEDGSYPGVANLTLHEIDHGPLRLRSRANPDCETLVMPIPVRHGATPVLGFRFGNFAYVTDTNFVPESSVGLLQGVDVLVLDALREDPHGTHYSIDEAIETAGRIGAAQTWLIHMTHSVLHAETDARLPVGVNLAWDGLRFEF